MNYAVWALSTENCIRWGIPWPAESASRWGHGGRREVRLGTMAAVMVPGFEALAAVLSRGADGRRVFRILSGKYPEYLAENAVPFRGRARYRPWQAMRGHTARALARGLRPPLHPRRGLPPSGFCSGGGWVAGARGVCGGFCYFNI